MSAFERTVSEADLRRLKHERDEADRRYNDALTAVDAALQRVPEFPHPPPPPDEKQVTPINIGWEILRHRPAWPAGWRGRVAAAVWRWIEPVLAAQQVFNAAVVDHINRNIQPQRESAKAIASTIAALQQQVEQLVFFQSRLIVYLQQLTPYVDTKDYEFKALTRRVIEDRQVEIERLDGVTRGLAAGISGVSDEMLKRWESLLARDQRYTGRIDELRASIAGAQQQVMALKRQFESTGLKSGPAGDTTRPAGEASGHAAREMADRPFSPADQWKYVGFEDCFRGSREEIRERLATYVPIFEGAQNVLDVGCGRGEFLSLLQERGISAAGVDLNREMVEECRSRGLQVVEGDAIDHLRSLPDASLGGLFAAQVVEHFEPSVLLTFLNEAHRAVKPGAAIVLETINAASWLAFFESYIRDLTHARPLHPDTLRYLVTASGFVDTEVRFSAPPPEANRLQRAPKALRQFDADDRDALVALADTFDGNVDRLNQLIFAHLDYAVIARRPGLNEVKGPTEPIHQRARREVEGR